MNRSPRKSRWLKTLSNLFRRPKRGRKGPADLQIERLEERQQFANLTISVATPDTYTELDPPMQVVDTATISGMTINAANAFLTVSLSSGVAGDVLSVMDQGLGDGKIDLKISGGDTEIHYDFLGGAGSQRIGKFTTPGSNSSPLIIDLSSAANTESVQALIRVLTYNSTSKDPTNGGANLTRKITIELQDGATANDTESVTINIAAVNNPPTITGPATLATNEDKAVTLTGLSIADPDANNNNVELRFDTASGTFNTAAVAGVTVSSDATYELILTGKLSDLNTYLSGGKVSYTPALNREIDETIVIQANDLGNTGGGALDSNKINLTIDLTAVNDAPDMQGNVVFTAGPEDTPPYATPAIGSLFTGPAAILDPDTGASVVGFVIESNGSTASGTWAFSSNGGTTWLSIGSPTTTAAVVIAANSLIRFTPNTDFAGTPPGLVVHALDNTYSGTFSNSTASLVTINLTTSPPTASGAVSLDTATIAAMVFDTPRFTGNANLAAGVEDTPPYASDEIGDLFAPVVVSPDGQAIVGFAIEANNSTADGTWEYSTNGTDWVVVSVTADTALVVSAATLFRFTPNTNFNGSTAGLVVRALDAGYAGAFSVTAAGSEVVVTMDLDPAPTSPTGFISLETAVLTASVTADNDAPVLSDTTVALAPVAEDAPVPTGAVGTLVSQLVDTVNGSGQDNVTDVDGPGLGIAITALDATNGDWYYSIDDGANWILIGAVSETSALVLAADADTRLYFRPDADFAGTIATAVTFKAWDGSDANSSGTTGVDTTAGTAFSAATDTASITVTAVNDAPVLADTVVTLNSVIEDAPVPTGVVGTLVSQLVDPTGGAGQNNVTDIDGPNLGIAITALDTANGDWYYTVDGGTNWILIGAVSSTSARLLLADADTRLYFRPDADFAGTIATAITFKAWDASDGELNGASGVDTTAGTAYSTATDTASIMVTAVNDAPVLNDTVVTLNPVAEDAPVPTGAVGTLVSQLVDPTGGGGQNNVADVDGPDLGIAVTALDATNGDWYFSTDDGANWTLIGAVSSTSALVLLADADTRLYFHPDADFSGTIAAALTFKAWDVSNATANGTTGVDTSTGTAFSSATDTASITVTAINDAPVLTDTVVTLDPIAEDAPVPTGAVGTLVSQLVDPAGGGGQNNVTDVDGPGLGIAITALNTSSGVWYYSTDDGASWNLIGAVSSTSARVLLADADTRIYFAPNLNFNGTLATAITFKAWDASDGETNGASGVDTTASTAYSSATDTASLTVTPVNDAPVLADTVVTLNPVIEDAPVPTGVVGTLVSQLVELAGGAGQNNVTDVDGTGLGLAITALDTANGDWYYTIDGGTNWVLIGAVSSTSALVLSADANTRLYFRPDADFAGTIASAVTFKAWDETDSTASGTTGVDTTVGTAYSTATDTASILVTAVNDAPVLADTVVALDPIAEDSPVPTGAVGTLVSQLVEAVGGGGQNNVTDVDGPGLGLAITALDTANGDWYYTTDGGTNWILIGAVSETSALVLVADANTRLYFHPSAGFEGSIPTAVTFKAWDESDTTANGTTGVDTTVGTAFSTATDTASITVTPVNDAPVLSDAVVTLNPLAEDAPVPTGAVGTLVSQLVDLLGGAGQNNVTDVDGPDLGIAITGLNTASGDWYYTIDGGANWILIGAVSSTSARVLLADADTRIYFTPDLNFNGTLATAITFKAWDASDGELNGASEVDTTVGTAYSTATDTASLTVTPVNDAPVLANTVVTLNPVIEDAPVPTGAVGTLVSQLVDLAGGAGQNNVTDVDGTGLGLAITALDTANGDWYYTIDGGTNWILIGAVSETSALVLSADANTRLYFRPDADFDATVATAITFKAWDETDSTANGTTGVDTTVGTAYSTATDTASITVTPVNDAPVLADTVVTLDDEAEDPGAPTVGSGTLVASLVDTVNGSGQDNVTDVDGPGLGIAITALDTANGSWFYSTNGGTSWTAIGGVSATSALVLAADANTRLFFAPDPDYNGTLATAITFKAWDRSDSKANGASGVDTNAGTAYSAATDTAALTITPVNDAPALTYSGGGYSTNEDAQLTLADLSIADIDAGSGVVRITFTAPDGTFQAIDTGGVDATASGATLTLEGTLANLNTYLNNGNAKYTPLLNRATDVTLSIQASDLGNSGAGGALLSNTLNLLVDIIPQNDAPVIANSSGYTTDEDTQVALSNLSISDVDAGGATIRITFTAPDGTFQAIDIGGVDATASGSTLTLEGSQANLNLYLAAGNAKYTPLLNRESDVTIAIQANDLGNSGAGSALDSNLLNVLIDIVPQNDAPVLTYSGGGYTTNEDVQLTLTDLSIADIDAGAGVVRITFTAPDGDFQAIDAGGVDATASGATLTLEGTLADLNTYLSNGNAKYTPLLNRETDVTLSIQASDLGNSGAGGAQLSNTLNLVVDIVPQNDAPLLSYLGLGYATDEDVQLTLSDLNVADVDAGSSSIQIFFSAPDGTFQATSGGGVTALVLGSTLTLTGSQTSLNVYIAGGNAKYTPLLNRETDVTISIQASDLGNSGFGGALQSPVVDVVVDIAPQNDAPVLTYGGSGYTTNEDTQVALTQLSVFDVDAGATTIRITFSAPDGSFQAASSGGVTASAVGSTLTLEGSQSDLNAYLLAGNAFYTPEPDRDVDLTLTVQASDLGNSGAGGPLLSNILSINLDIIPQNDAPILIDTVVALNPIDEDPGLPGVGDGTLISDVVDLTGGGGQNNVIDPDGPNLGIAITALDTTNGSWFYSTNNGSTWLAIGPVSETSAFVLFANGTTRIYFAPNANFFGTIANAVTFKAWDRSNGVGNATSGVDTTIFPVTSSPYSATTDVASMTVVSINDAPVLSASATLPSIAEDTANPPGATISALFGGFYSDIEGDAFAGVAISENTADPVTEGSWQYTTNGTDWFDIGTVSAASSLFLSATTLVRFLPVTNFNGTPPNIRVRAIDGTYLGVFSSTTSGVETRVTASTVTNGDGTPLSATTRFVLTSVDPRNDAPILDTAPAPIFPPLVEDQVAPVGTQTVNDLVAGRITEVPLDNAVVNAIAIVSVDNTFGIWEYTLNGADWFAIGTGSGVINLAGNALLLQTTNQIRFVPNPNGSGTASIQYRAWDQTDFAPVGARIDLTGVGATGGEAAYSANVETATITVDPVADAPNVTPAVTNEDTLSTSGLVITRNAADGAEVQFFRISNIQNGRLYADAGMTDEITNGEYITVAQGAAGLYFDPDPDSDLDGSFDIRSALSNDGTTDGPLTATAAIDVRAVADAPTLSVTGTATGDENSPIALAINPALVDTDGSETLSIRITNVPATAVLSAGTNLGGGIWELTPAELAGLTITLVDGTVGFSLSVTAIATEAALDAAVPTAMTVDTINVLVNNVAPTPTITTVPAGSITEGSSFTYQGSFTDPAGSADNVYTYFWDVLDASNVVVASASGSVSYNLSGATLVGDFTFTPNDNGLFTVRLTVRDKDNAPGVDSHSQTVTNVAPTGTLTSDGPIDEGGTVNVFFTGLFDPSSVDLATLRFSFATTFAGLDATYAAASGANAGAFTFANNGTFTVFARVFDKDGGSTDYSINIVVDNVAPQVSNIAIVDPTLGTPLTEIEEGDSIRLTADITDPGADSVTYTIDWGDGDSDTVTLTALQRTIDFVHLYRDDPTSAGDNYVITITVVDEDLAAGTPQTAGIIVENVAPLIAPIADVNLTEGQTLNLPGRTFFDPGVDDVWTVDVDYGEGAGYVPVTPTVMTFDLSNLYEQDGAYLVRVRVTDDDGGSHVLTFNVDVSNVPPTPSIDSISAVRVEGTAINVGISATDPGALDILTYSWNVYYIRPDTTEVLVESGVFNNQSSGSAQTFSFLPADNGNYRIELVVSDDDTAVSTSQTIAVANVDPVLGPTPSGPALSEGQNYQLVVDWTDAGFDNPTQGTTETFTIVIDWGDGTIETLPAPVTPPGAPGPTVGQFLRNHVYADNGTYTIVVTLTDDDGGDDAYTFSATVANVDPTFATGFTPVGAQTVNEGTTLSLVDIVVFSDPGFDNPANPNALPLGSRETFTYTINWGDGMPVDSGTADIDQLGSAGVLTRGSLDGAHIYADNGLYTVTVTITDDDLGTLVHTFQVTVLNTAPTLDGGPQTANQTVNEGQLLALTDVVRFRDLGFDNPANPNQQPGGSRETFTYSINWGDGSAVETGAATIDQPGGPGVFTLGSIDEDHHFADDGVYRVRVTITDDDGGQLQYEFDVTVNNLAPELDSALTTANVDEGAVLSLPNIIRFRDAGFDNPANPNQQPGGSRETFTYSINWGDGSAIDTGAARIDAIGSPTVFTRGSVDAAHRFADNGVYVATITITDDNGGVLVHTCVITVDNVAPTIVAGAGSLSAKEGDILTFANLVTLVDPGFTNPAKGTQETFSYLVDWGDGNASAGAPLVTQGSPGVQTVGSVTEVHTYADDGTYTVRVTVTDDDGGISNVHTFTVVVANVAPKFVGLPSQIAIAEGELFELGPLSFTDPGFNNHLNLGAGREREETFSVTIDFGDIFNVVASRPFIRHVDGKPGRPTEGSITDTHLFVRPGFYDVRLTLRDDDGGVTTAVIRVLVIDRPGVGFSLPEAPPSVTITVPPPPTPLPPSLSLQLVPQQILFDESSSGQRQTTNVKQSETRAEIRIHVRVERLSHYRGAVEYLVLDKVVSSSEKEASLRLIADLPNGIYRLTLSSVGLEPTVRELELTNENRPKMRKAWLSLWQDLQSSDDPESRLRIIFPTPATSRLEPRASESEGDEQPAEEITSTPEDGSVTDASEDRVWQAWSEALPLAILGLDDPQLDIGGWIPAAAEGLETVRDQILTALAETSAGMVLTGAALRGLQGDRRRGEEHRRRDEQPPPATPRRS